MYTHTLPKHFRYIILFRLLGRTGRKFLALGFLAIGIGYRVDLESKNMGKWSHDGHGFLTGVLNINVTRGTDLW